MTIPLTYFHDNLNIVVTIDPGCKFPSDKCDQFPLTFIELN